MSGSSLSTCNCVVADAASRAAVIASYPSESTTLLSHRAASLCQGAADHTDHSGHSFSVPPRYVFATMKLIAQKKAILCVKGSVREGLGPSGAPDDWCTVLATEHPTSQGVQHGRTGSSRHLDDVPSIPPARTSRRAAVPLHPYTALAIGAANRRVGEVVHRSIGRAGPAAWTLRLSTKSTVASSATTMLVRVLSD